MQAGHAFRYALQRRSMAGYGLGIRSGTRRARVAREHRVRLHALDPCGLPAGSVPPAVALLAVDMAADLVLEP